MDKILANLQRTSGVFDSPLYTKLFAVTFLVLSCMGNRGVKKETISKHRIVAIAATGSVLFFGNGFLLSERLPALLYIGTLLAGFFCLLAAGLWVSRLLKSRFSSDVFNAENESFMQETRKITNEYSVNLLTRFTYKGREWDG